MNKIVSIKTTSAIFLAIVLVAGTFALSIPSFMIAGTAQALPYYGQDNYDKKSDAKNVSVKSVKCNNVNVNVNGLELTVLPPALANLLQGDEGDSGASSYGNGGSYGGQSGYDNNSFKFICINNNNNTVVVEEEPLIPPVVDECAEADEIEACFEENLIQEQFPRLVAALESEAGLTVEINGEDITLRSFADICSALDGLTFEQLQDAILAILTEITPPGELILIPFMLEDCIAEALDIPITPPPPP